MANNADFISRFPEFASVDPARIDMFLGDAQLLMGGVDDGRWLDFYDVSQLYLTAHLLSVANNTATGDFGALAPIKKQEVDDVVIEQAVANIEPTLDEFYSTSYGKSYVRYRKILFSGPRGV